MLMNLSLKSESQGSKTDSGECYQKFRLMEPWIKDKKAGRLFMLNYLILNFELKLNWFELINFKGKVW